MKIKTHLESSVSLESVAITDIILNMFIFFFTSFSLVYTFNPAKESRIMVKLPQADIIAPVDQKEPIIININKRNEVFLGGKSKSLKELKSELESLIASNHMRPVIIRADKSVIFDRVVQVLNVAQNVGVERVGIGIEEKATVP